MNNIFRITTFLLLLSLITGCDDGRYDLEGGKSNILELSASLNQPSTKSNLKGDKFLNGDSFILYKGSPVNSDYTSEYKLTDNQWQGAPGLFWDDLPLSDSIRFTAIATNGGGITLTGDPSFSIATDQNKDTTTYKKNDLLIAYGVANYSVTNLRKLKLVFSHVFAHLVLKIEDQTQGNETPKILAEESKVTLHGIKTGNKLAFNPQDSTTTVTVNGTGTDVILRKVSIEGNTHIYEAIIPAQSLANGISMSISDNVNDKTYTYDLSNATIKVNGQPDDKTKLLKQGYTTTISLKIEKTSLSDIDAKIIKWVNKSAEATATPDDYPVIEIGDGSGGGDDGGLSGDDDYAGKTIRLTQDVDASTLGLPLGSREKPFRGTFDGQGYTIHNVELAKDTAFLGVFGYTDGATIKNLNIKGVKIENSNASTSTATGGLAGFINNTYIDNCHVLEYDGSGKSNSVSSKQSNVGGLVGYVNGVSTIKNSSASTDVKADYDYAGGFIGKGEEGMIITHCFAKNKAEARRDYAGGFIGYSTKNSSIEYCFAWGEVEARSYGGGFSGRSEETIIKNCYSAGSSVTARSYRAAFVGYSQSLTVSNCYWNAALSTVGVNGTSINNTNSSFTILNNQAAMQTVLNGLNRQGETIKVEWGLDKGYGQNILPYLINNTGKARPKN